MIQYKPVGLAFLSLYPFLTNCQNGPNYNTVQPQQVQPSRFEFLTPSQLDKIVLDKVKARLSKMEFTVGDYEDYIHETLGSLTYRPTSPAGGYGNMDFLHDSQRKFFIDLTAMFIKGTMEIEGIKSLNGLNEEYLVLNSTPISEYVRNDIDAYKKVVNELVLGAVIQINRSLPIKTPFYLTDITDKFVENHLRSNYPNLLPDRIKSLRSDVRNEIFKKVEITLKK